MLKICLFCTFILFLSEARAQDLRAVTDDKREVILRSTGIWYFADRADIKDCTATLPDGRKVLLSGNGTWTIKSKTEPAPSDAGSAAEGEGSGGSSSQDAGRCYDSIDHFSIEFPDGWEARQKAHALACSPKGQESDRFAPTIKAAAGDLGPESNLDDYAAVAVRKLQRIVQGYQEIDKGETVIAGTRALWVTYTGSLGDMMVEAKLYFLTNADKVIEISYVSRREAFSSYSNAFESVAQSFRFE